YGKGLAPVSLATENGIAQTIIYSAFAGSCLFQFGNYFWHPFGIGKSVEKIRILIGEIFFPHKKVLLVFVADVENRFDFRHSLLSFKMGRKFVIAFITGRNGHYGSGAIARQDIIAHPNRKGFFSERMLGIGSGKYPGNGF